MTKEKPVTVIQNIARALEILSCFSINQPELGISEIATQLGIYRSTVYRVLKTLEQYGYVIQNSQNQRYRLGFKFFDLGTVVISKLEVRDVALPYMQRLCAETRETIALNVADNDERVCIEKVESPESIRNVIPIGYRNPIYFTAAGKALLAFYAEGDLERIISSKRLQESALGKSIDVDSFRNELRLIAQRGYALSHSEVSAGTSAVAAPIYNYEQHVIASLSTHGPEHRFMDKGLEILIEKTVDTAREISIRLGWK
ncbi:IclR family transcriptional regulator [Desulfosporosinus sp. PR]|uniref:IclR family transcriptional regulator n=1 Tax=Candidatus Desulfosporosinus nitrosoreducens TaxID=3401928 RepID=UPI0027E5FA26|nr:IclR family transcriptional regulator [Desulfosporosinus sp. PR]MDQ7095423.1 IclR family transcriptional regulator [Desulfosporosinus sp. PR]